MAEAASQTVKKQKDIRRHRAFCSACQTLRDDRNGVTEPHSQLMFTWTDPENPAVSVYVCRDCKCVLIANRNDSLHRWK